MGICSVPDATAQLAQQSQPCSAPHPAGAAAQRAAPIEPKSPALHPDFMGASKLCWLLGLAPQALPN